jgi:hypothetical protein
MLRDTKRFNADQTAGFADNPDRNRAVGIFWWPDRLLFLLSPVMVVLIPLFGNGGTLTPAIVEQAFFVVTVVVYVLQLGVFAWCVFRLCEKYLPI